MKRGNGAVTAAAWLALGIGLAGLCCDPDGAVPGLIRIMTAQDLLITDYLAVGGLGGALVCQSLVLLAAAGLLYLSGDELHGFTFAELGLVAGFSLFGKNPANVWPILLGTWLYARCRREPFHRYVGVALLATALAPLVSWMMFGSAYRSLPGGVAVGLLIGFVMPTLSAYTYKVLNGMSLYNAGFACGLLALMAVPILAALGDRPDTVLIWSEDYSLPVGLALNAASLVCILAGLLAAGERPGMVLAKWRRLLRTSGRMPCDWYRDFGLGTVLLNIGVNGLLGVGYVLLIGGAFSGPVAGGVLTLMGFGAGGKHVRNCVPVMAGVALGALFLHESPAVPSLQIAGLFGTTLAPIAGTFGIPAGVLAGFLHSALVVQTGGPVAGMNLYNNGFSGGLIAVVLYPLLTALHRRRPHLQKADYLDTLEGEEKPAEET